MANEGQDSVPKELGSLSQPAATAERHFSWKAAAAAAITAASLEASYLTTGREPHTTQTTIKLVIAAASDSF